MENHYDTLYKEAITVVIYASQTTQTTPVSVWGYCVCYVSNVTKTKNFHMRNSLKQIDVYIKQLFRMKQLTSFTLYLSKDGI